MSVHAAHAGADRNVCNIVVSTETVYRFGKVYFESLTVSLGHCGCIYDKRTIKFKCLMNN